MAGGNCDPHSLVCLVSLEIALVLSDPDPLNTCKVDLSIDCELNKNIRNNQSLNHGNFKPLSDAFTITVKIKADPAKLYFLFLVFWRELLTFALRQAVIRFGHLKLF